MSERVLILCTGNSARSQMAEGLLRAMAGERFEVASAGVAPSNVRPEAIEVMSEIGIDISKQREHCPIFPGQATLIHWSFDDPAAAPGDEVARLKVFRRVRDEIKEQLTGFTVFTRL